MIGPISTFDVRKFGATGDGSTDDTTAIAAAFAAAAAHTALSSSNFARIEIPRGVYVVGTATSAITSAVTVSGDRIRLVGEGTIKLAGSFAGFAAVCVTGDHCGIDDLTIDGNATGNPSGRGECLRVQGDYGLYRNVTCQNTDDSGAAPATYIIVNDPLPVHNRFINCKSLNSGAMAYDNRGDFSVFRDCVALEYKAQGFSQGGGSSAAGGIVNLLTVDGFFSKSSVTTNVGFIVDVSVNVDRTGYMVDTVNLKNITVDFSANTVAGNGVKFSRINNLTIDNLRVYHSSTAYHSLRMAEALGKVRIANSYLAQDVFQEGATYDAIGALTSATADPGSGYARFTSTSHGLYTNDWIVFTGTDSYDGLHQVTAVSGNTFDTDWKFSNADAAGTFSNTIADLDVSNTTIGTIGNTAALNCWDTLRAYRTKFNKLRFRNFSVCGIDIENSLLYAHEAYKSIDVIDCDFVSAFTTATDSVIRSPSSGGSTEFTQPNVIRWIGNTYRSIGSNAGRLTHASTVPVISRDKARFYRTLAASVTLTENDSGGVFHVTAADIVVTLPSVGSTTNGGGAITYTFVLASAGLSTGTGLSISPNAADKIMGNGFTSADNKDAILAGSGDREGDAITLMSDGTNGWLITNVVGTWTRE